MSYQRRGPVPLRAQPGPYHQLAYIYAKYLKKTDQAVDYANRAIALNPADIEAYQRLCEIELAAGQEQKALLRDEIVQLELSNLEVQPGTAAHVVEADVHGLESEGPLVVGGEEQDEGDVLPQRSRRPQVDPRQIEAVRSDGPLRLAAGGAPIIPTLGIG